MQNLGSVEKTFKFTNDKVYVKLTIGKKNIFFFFVSKKVSERCAEKFACNVFKEIIVRKVFY